MTEKLEGNLTGMMKATTTNASIATGAHGLPGVEEDATVSLEFNLGALLAKTTNDGGAQGNERAEHARANSGLCATAGALVQPPLLAKLARSKNESAHKSFPYPAHCSLKC